MGEGSGTLWVVATPLGNLEDISTRSARLLRQVPTVYAEDTRRTRVLLDHIGSSAKLKSLHAHNENQRTQSVLDDLEEGLSVALVSDAGTPAVSDPGAILVGQAARAGHQIAPVPGPSALSAALSVCGFFEPQSRVLFVGFLPAKGKDRKAALETVASHSGVVVLFEGPHRIAKTLTELAEPRPDRPACLCRELTKVHEEIRHETVGELRENPPTRGEVTLVLGPVTQEAPNPEADLDTRVQQLLDAGLSPRDCAAALRAILGVPKKRAYERALALKG